MTLVDYIRDNSYRGACKCGKCVDSGDNPEEHQPEGHTVDLTFFKVALIGEPSKDEFEELTADISELLKEGTEIGYMQLGGMLGDQGMALQVMAIGDLLGVWKVNSPESMLPFMDAEMKMQMAGQGMISIQTKE